MARRSSSSTAWVGPRGGDELKQVKRALAAAEGTQYEDDEENEDEEWERRGAGGRRLPLQREALGGWRSSAPTLRSAGDELQT